MRFVRVSSKGQIVLPKVYRNKLGIGDGDYLSLELKDGVLTVEKSEVVTEWEQELEPLRKAAKEQDFTREELMKAIKAIRKERKANAA